MRDEKVEALRRLYADVLPERVRELEALLERAWAGEDGVLGALYRAAHSLEGTAPAYGASGVALPAARLAERVRGWQADGVPRDRPDLRDEARELVTSIAEEAGRWADTVG